MKQSGKTKTTQIEQKQASTLDEISNISIDQNFEVPALLSSAFPSERDEMIILAGNVLEKEVWRIVGISGLCRAISTVRPLSVHEHACLW